MVTFDPLLFLSIHFSIGGKMSSNLASCPLFSRAALLHPIPVELGLRTSFFEPSIFLLMFSKIVRFVDLGRNRTAVICFCTAIARKHQVNAEQRCPQPYVGGTNRTQTQRENIKFSKTERHFYW